MGETLEYGVSQADLEVFQCAVGTSCSGIGEERPVLGVAEAGDMRLLQGLSGYRGYDAWSPEPPE
jgi:hypothetical protein